MEIINELSSRDIGSSLLRLNRDIKKIGVYASKINEMKEDLDAKLKYMQNIQKQLYVYKYIVINLLNLAQKWCVDNGSPVYFFVMNNARDTCSHCNTGQGSETNCGENYYNEAYDTSNTVDYGFCGGCQSIYTTGSADCLSCDSSCYSYNGCQGYDSCQSCNSGCQGRDSCQSCDGGCQGRDSGTITCGSAYTATCTSGNTPTYCNACFGGCQGGDSCQVCDSVQSIDCINSFSVGPVCCQSSYSF